MRRINFTLIQVEHKRSFITRPNGCQNDLKTDILKTGEPTKSDKDQTLFDESNKESIQES